MENRNTPIDFEIVKKNIDQFGSHFISKGNIRVMRKIVNDIEAETGERFIRMEMGIPGLKPSKIGIEAEIESHKYNPAGVYPPIEGIPSLKKEFSRFLKLFLNVDVSAEFCMPSVGSVQGGFVSFLTSGRATDGKDTILFVDPGFSVHKGQVKMAGLKYDSFDVYDYRGEKLRAKLTEIFKQGNIAAMLYSNPNNPSWICFTEEELKIIGETAKEYGVIVIEDMAYFAMDFRKDYSQPGQPPYPPTVANYTDEYILLVSSSKAFSYAGQRIGMLAVSEKLYNKKFDNLGNFFTSDIFGNALMFGALLLTTAGVSHTTQFGLAAILKAANDGEYNFLDEVKDYGRKAEEMKKFFLNTGFDIVYDKDGDQPLADGFYFTVSFGEMSGEELVEKLLYYGISAIPLGSTGSTRTKGIRICVSLVPWKDLSLLEERLKIFQEQNS